MPRRWQYPSWAIIDRDALTRPEVTTPDKWWQPFSEPVRQNATKLALTVLIVTSGIAPIDPEILTQPEATSLDKWFQPLSEFQHTTKRSAAALEPASVIDSDQLTLPEAISLDKWYRPLIGIGVEKQLRLSGPDSFPQPPVIETITLDKWYQQFSEPLRVKTPINVSFGEFRTELELAAPEEITLDKWYSPLTEPLRVKKPLPVASYPSSWDDSDALTRPEITSLDKWWRPLSEFLHRVKRSAAALEPASVIDSDLLTRPEETLVSKWVPQTSEPVRIKARLLTALQEAFFIDANIAAVPPAEEITLDKWYKPLEEPVRVKPRASEFPAHTNDTEGLTLPEVTSLDKWFSPLSEPVRVQPKSLAGLLSGATYEGEPSDVEPLAEFMGWFRGLDEPVLPLVLPVAHYPATFFEQEVSELDPSAEQLAWYVPLTDPTLPKPRVVEFLAFTIDTEGLAQPEVTSLDKWWRELSEPVRTQPRSLAALISGETKVDEPSDLDPVAERFEWYRDLDLPTLPKVRVAEFTAFVIDAELLTLPETTTLDKWWRELSEPVRVKARFLEALQLHIITDITFDIAEIITLDKWYTPLDEPVRLGDRLVVPFRLPASVGREYQVAVIPIKGRISKEADQTHISKEADQTHISKEADQTKDSKRC